MKSCYPDLINKHLQIFICRCYFICIHSAYKLIKIGSMQWDAETDKTHWNLPYKQGVTGSNPVVPTRLIEGVQNSEIQFRIQFKVNCVLSAKSGLIYR